MFEVKCFLIILENKQVLQYYAFNISVFFYAVYSFEYININVKNEKIKIHAGLNILLFG